MSTISCVSSNSISLVLWMWERSISSLSKIFWLSWERISLVSRRRVGCIICFHPAFTMPQFCPTNNPPKIREGSNIQRKISNNWASVPTALFHGIKLDKKSSTGAIKTESCPPSLNNIVPAIIPKMVRTPMELYLLYTLAARIFMSVSSSFSVLIRDCCSSTESFLSART